MSNGVTYLMNEWETLFVCQGILVWVKKTSTNGDTLNKTIKIRPKILNFKRCYGDFLFFIFNIHFFLLYDIIVALSFPSLPRVITLKKKGS